MWWDCKGAIFAGGVGEGGRFQTPHNFRLSFWFIFKEQKHKRAKRKKTLIFKKRMEDYNLRNEYVLTCVCSFWVPFKKCWRESDRAANVAIYNN